MTTIELIISLAILGIIATFAAAPPLRGPHHPSRDDSQPAGVAEARHRAIRIGASVSLGSASGPDRSPIRVLPNGQVLGGDGVEMDFLTGRLSAPARPGS